MEGTNLHIINGTVVKKPELKAVGEANQVANFSVACNRTYTNRESGQKEKDTQYINIECWGKVAVNAAKYLDKGSNVHIQGEVRTDKWQAEDGTNRYRTKTLVKQLTFLPNGGQAQTVSAEEAAEQVENLKNESQSQAQKQTVTAPVTDQAFGGEDDDEDLPF